MSDRALATGRRVRRDNISSIYLNGSNADISLGNILSTEAVVTACLWFKLPTLPSGNFEIIFGYNNNRWYFIAPGASKQMRFSVNIPSENSVTTTKALEFNKWYFLTGRYDPAGGANNQRLRIYDENGVLHQSVVATRTGSMNTTGNQLRAGYDSGRGYRMDAYFDELRVYNRFLSDSELDALALNVEPSTVNIGGYWRLDEGSGNAIVDSTGLNADGVGTNHTYTTDTPYSMPIAVRSNVSCVQFNGSTDYATIAQTSGVPAYSNQQFTLSFYAKNRDTNQLDKRLYSEGNSGTVTPLYCLGTGAGANEGRWLRLFVRDDAGSTLVNLNTFANVIERNRWHRITLTDNNGVVKLFVDGRKVASASYTRTAITIDRVSIAAMVQSSVSSYFNGLMDDIQIFNVAMTEAEVRSHYLKVHAPSANRKLHLKMDENTGSTLTDSSGNGNTGTLINSGWVTNDLPFKQRATA